MRSRFSHFASLLFIILNSKLSLINLYFEEEERFKMPMGGLSQGRQAGGQTCFDKVKMGFMMGFSIGMTTGLLFGGFQAFRLGLRGRELFTTLGKSMGQAGGSFGLFMSVGTALRC